MHRYSLALLLVLSGSAALASDEVEFERTGLSTLSLPTGKMTWEQGLPNLWQDPDERGISTNALFRVGIGHGFELQLGSDVWQQVKTRGEEPGQRWQGAGDSHISLKYAPSNNSEQFGWAVMLTRYQPTGREPLASAEAHHDISFNFSHAPSDSQSLELYGYISHSEDGSGWQLAPSYNWALNERSWAYLELTIGEKTQYTRTLGTGITWMLNPRIQLDASVARGLNQRSTDWQGGLGIAVLLN